MPFTIKFTDPTTSTSITVPDMPPGINTTDTDLSLVGRGYPNYGQKIAENFLHLLENFSNGTPPAHAVQGELWYDNVNNKLKVNTVTGGQRWSPVNGVWQQSTDPSLSTITNVLPGDIWVNTSDNNYILSVRTNNSGWVQVSNTSTGATGSFSTELFDSLGNPHYVVEHKSLGEIIAIDTADSFYPNPVIPNFNPQLFTGTNMTTVGKFWGTAFSADALNLYSGVQTLRVPTDRFLIKDDTAGGDIPGQGQIITGRVYWQNTDGIVLTSSDDTYGTSKGKIQIKKSGNDLVLLNDRNPDYGYGNIVLKTRLGRGSIKVESAAQAYSTVTGALTVQGGVGIGGNLYVNGSLWVSTASQFHITTLVVGYADNVFAGAPGEIIYQINTSTTGFITTASTGSSVLVSGGSQAPYYQTTGTVRVGYSDNTNNILGGSAGQFVVQSAANQTSFINPGSLSVATATYASYLLGGSAGTFLYQTGVNQTGFLQPSAISVNTATNVAGGSAGQFVVQTGAGQTGFKSGNTLSVSTASNLSGGAKGSLAYQSTSGVTTFLAIGISGKYLKSNGSTPEWDSPVGLGVGYVAYGAGTGSELTGDSGMAYDSASHTLTLSGDVVAGSDRDIKDNIETITDALTKTLALRGVSFNYKKGGRPNLGLIAQEVQTIIPEIVSVNENTGFLGIGYNALIGLLVEAIKEQQLQIDELKRRIG